MAEKPETGTDTGPGETRVREIVREELARQQAERPSPREVAERLTAFDATGRRPSFLR